MSQKIIKDLVHGYICVDDDICKIIDNVSFQRLKGISQLTAHHLYPSTNHTRFEHSLGVMDLALKFFDQLKPQLLEKITTEDKENKIIYLRENLRFSSLLHDIGHGPLSHLGQEFYDENEIINAINNLHICKNEDYVKGAKHEKMSCYIIGSKFKA